LATISSALSPVARRSAADFLKNDAVSSEMVWQAMAEVLDAAFSAASLDGGPVSSNLNPCPTLLSILTISRACLGSKRRTDTPELPARPVLPER